MPIEVAHPSRRNLLVAAKRVVVAGVVAGGAYPFFVEPRRLAITRRAFPVRNLPPELDGLRVVQLTDIHLGPWNSVGYVRDVVAAANSLDPDLVALTGDYVLRSSDYVAPAAATLAGLRAKVGVVGVLGNHDWWEDGPLSHRELTRVGVRMVDNARVFVTPSRQLTDSPQEGLCVAGVGDLYTNRQLYDQALGGLPGDMPRLLLSHNPDVAEERPFVTSGLRVDLMLSGHTHGGQIRLPVIGAPVTMSRYGQKYLRGLVQGPACPVYISRGLGMAMLPVRLGSVPEIAVI
jgi:predicted MPP superfamily phosphohydrolase